MTKQNKRYLKRLFLSTGILFLLFIFIKAMHIDNSLELIATDYKYKYFNRASILSNEIILIDIDNNSLKELSSSLGQYPWPRSIYKDLIEFIQLGEPKGILFDILFSEKQGDGSSDNILAGVSDQYKTVSHAIEFSKESSFVEGQHKNFPNNLLDKLNLNILNKEILNNDLTNKFNGVFSDFSSPVEPLLNKTHHLHFVNSTVDIDGVFRSTPLIYKYDNLWLPSLSLQALLFLTKDPSLKLSNNKIVVLDGQVEKFFIPIEKDGRFLIHYYSNYKNLPQHIAISYLMAQARKLASGQISDPSELEINPLEFFKDKIILIGASATGLYDLKATPVDSSLPGVHIHSTVISNILNNEFQKQSPYWLQLVLLLIGIILIYAFIFFISSVYLKAVLPLLVIVLLTLVDLLAFKYFSFEIPIVALQATFFVAYLEGFIFTTIIEGRKSKKITGTFSKYLSEDLTKYLIENEINPSAEVGKQQELSILFSDIRGFTSFSERLPPKDLVELLNKYLNTMSHIIINNKGTMDKYIGDAIMAFWGAPVFNEDHAYWSVLTAIQMTKALESFNKDKENPIPLDIGIGINTGVVIVGNIGSEKKLDYTVIGDNVNLASRIEGLTKYYGVAILIGETTYQKIKTRIPCRIIDLVKAKGKNEAVHLYSPLLENHLLDPKSWIELSEKAFLAYKNGNFDDALKIYYELLKLNSTDTVVKLFIARCEELIKIKPVKWDGVFTATSK